MILDQLSEYNKDSSDNELVAAEESGALGHVQNKKLTVFLLLAKEQEANRWQIWGTTLDIITNFSYKCLTPTKRDILYICYGHCHNYNHAKIQINMLNLFIFCMVIAI